MKVFRKGNLLQWPLIQQLQGYHLHMQVIIKIIFIKNKHTSDVVGRHLAMGEWRWSYPHPHPHTLFLVACIFLKITYNIELSWSPPPHPFVGMQKMEVKIRNLTPQLKVKVYFSPPFPFLIKVFMFLKTTLFFLFFLIVKIFWMQLFTLSKTIRCYVLGCFIYKSYVINLCVNYFFSLFYRKVNLSVLSEVCRRCHFGVR